MGVGAAVAGVSAISSIAGGYAQRKQAEHEKDQLKTQHQLEQRKLGQQRVKAVGNYVSDVGASGVKLNLNDVARMDTELQLDQEVAAEQYKMERASLDLKGKQAVTSGYMGALSSIAGGFGSGGPKLPSGKLSVPTLGTAYNKTGLRSSYGGLNYKTNPFGIKLR